MEEKKTINSTGIAMIMIITMLTILVAITFLTSCTYTIAMVHTEGQASDVVDETSTNTPSTNLSVPVNIIPNPLM